MRWSIVSLVVFAIDRLVKSFFVKNPDVHQDFLFGTAFRFVKNPGIAFSLSVPSALLIIIITGALVFLMFFMFRAGKSKRDFLFFAFSLVFLGALSNYIDRILYSYVVDYVDFPYFTVLNIADIMITLGLVLIVADEWLLSKAVAGKKQKNTL